MRIIPVESVRCARRPSIEELLNPVASLLKSGRVEFTVKINEKGWVDGEDVKNFHALKALGVRKIPVSKNRRERVSISLEELGFYEDVSPSLLRVHRDPLDLLRRGWPTPLIRLRSLSSIDEEVWAKLEMFNPFSNSVKDRIGWYMLWEAWEEGALKGGGLIYEASSTNTGIALTSVGNNLGVKTRIYLPSTVQKCSDVFLKALGADVVRVPEQLTIEAIDKVKATAEQDGALHINQFENDANFLVHLRFTAKELDLQIREVGVKPARIVGALGTSGHLSALSIYFKNRYGKGVEVIGVQPAKDEVIPGMRRTETWMKWVNMVEIDEVMEVTRKEAVEGLMKVARGDGLPIGLSSGAVASAHQKLPRKSGATILIFPDHIYKYHEQLQQIF